MFLNLATGQLYKIRAWTIPTTSKHLAFRGHFTNTGTRHYDYLAAICWAISGVTLSNPLS